MVINGKLSLNLSLSFSPQSLFAPVLTSLSFSQHTSSPFLPFCSYVCISVLVMQQASVGNTGMPLQARLSSCKEEQTDPLYHLPPTNCCRDQNRKLLPSIRQPGLYNQTQMIVGLLTILHLFDNFYYNLIKTRLECCYNCIGSDGKITVLMKFQSKTTKT